MNNRSILSAEVLSQLVLMQSVVAQLPDEVSMLNFSCEGLKDISGVNAVSFKLHEQDISFKERLRRQEKETLVFHLKRNNNIHADLIFFISDPERFSVYIPYIQNFCSMLSLIFEERQQRRVNKDLMMNLEQRVIERTSELELQILERQRAEEAVAEEKERLAVTLRSIGDGVVTTDINGNVVLMNKVAEFLTGWELEDAKGKPLNMVFHIIDEISRVERESPVEKVLTSGKIIELANHTILISKDGTERAIADSGAPIKDNNGVIIGVVLVFRDMTEKQKLLDTIQRTAKLDSLGILAGGIAHDFNNLLCGIYGYVDMAFANENKDEANRSLLKAISTIERARGLAQQLLTFAKGGEPIKKTDMLFPFVEETVRFVLSGSNVSLAMDVQSDLWSCSFDKNQIGQVIDNIVINAQQAMPLGGVLWLIAKNVYLEGKSHHGLPAGRYLQLSIKDNGIGIPKDFLSRIFDPFFTTKEKGHGLGLATSYSIISRHGGAIEVTSEPGEGSVFNIFLPASDISAGVSSPDLEASHKGTGIFVVLDDEEVIRDINEAILKSFGYTVVTAETGAEVVEFLKLMQKQNKKITGMIFDLTIRGGMGGKETVREVRKLCSETPVFIASGYADDPVIANPKDYGFTASISKPFTKAELARFLNTYLSK